MLLLHVVTHYNLSCCCVSEGCIFPKSGQTFPQWRGSPVILQTQRVARLFRATHKVLQTCVSHSCSQSDSRGSTDVRVTQKVIHTCGCCSTFCDSIQLSATQFSSNGATQFNLVQTSSTRCNSILFSVTRFNLVRLNSTRCDSDQLSATQINSV